MSGAGKSEYKSAGRTVTSHSHTSSLQLAGSGEDDGRWQQRALVVVGALFVVRMISLWFNNSELFFDEAQYWAWAKTPEFGYFSKPPLLAWLIGGFTSVCGDSEFCVRLMSPVLHSATALIVFFLTRQLIDARTAFWAAAAYATLPAVTLSATLVSTDVPLLLFWALALYAFVRFEATLSVGWAIALGVAIGLGMLAKYAMIYFVICTFIYCLFDRKRLPHLLGDWRLWLAFGVAALVLAPNILWNVANDFATAGHTGENIGWDGGLHPARMLEFLASQFAVMGPILFALFLAGIVRLPLEGMTRQQYLLLCYSVPVLALITLQALMSKAYANWAALTYVAATILVADFMTNHIPELWRRASFAIHLVVLAVVSIGVAFAAPGQIPGPANPFVRMQGAREIAARAADELKARPSQGVLVDNRRLAALMTYYLRHQPAPILAWRNENSPGDYFEMRRSIQDNPVADVLLITQSQNPAAIVSAFGLAELLGELEPRGEVASRVWLYRLSGYRGSAN